MGERDAQPELGAEKQRKRAPLPDPWAASAYAARWVGTDTAT